MIDFSKYFTYDKESGSFTRILLEGRPNVVARFHGKPTGHIRKDGYVVLSIGTSGKDGKLYYAHRVAWLMTYGEIPENWEVDHIDRNPSNNRISNLRLVTSEGNSRNTSARKNASSIYKGVYWSKARSKWVSQFNCKDFRKHLGYFDDEYEAYLARLAAEQAYYGEL